MVLERWSTKQSSEAVLHAQLLGTYRNRGCFGDNCVFERLALTISDFADALGTSLPVCVAKGFRRNIPGLLKVCCLGLKRKRDQKERDAAPRSQSNVDPRSVDSRWTMIKSWLAQPFNVECR